MSSTFRRFEILLPLRFNDGRPVPDELIADTLLELEQRFGAVSSETQTIQGFWQHQGHSYRDDLTRLSGRPGRPRKPRLLPRPQRAAEGPLPADRHLDDDLPRRSDLTAFYLSSTGGFEMVS